MTGLVLALLLGADPCGPLPPPTGGGDPEAARAYRAVGDAERAGGALQTAAVAYREALAQHPADAAARAALEEVCRALAGPAAFERGRGLLEAGDLRGAAAAFREARAAGAGAPAALLEGVAEFELGDDAAARAALTAARQDPAQRDAADLYLGLLALREGDGAAAARALEAASQDPALAPLASRLARSARRTGSLVVAALAAGGWDSNAQLAPSGTPIDTSSDGQLDAAAGALWRPLGPSGPFVAGRGLLHQQFRFDDLDQWGLGGSGGWQLVGPGRGVSAEYGYDYRTLGGAPFLSAHGPRATGWLPAGPLTLAASYALRFESYDGDLYAPFSGTFQSGEVSASALVAPGLRLLLGYRLARDAVELPELSFLEHGPHAALWADVGARGRLFLDAALGFRGYDAFDPLLGVLREEVSIDATAAFEWDVSARAFLRVGVEVRQVWSTAEAYGYFRLAPTVGLGWVAGL